MPKYSPPSLWFIPLRKEWPDGHIPIMQRAGSKVVLLAVGRTANTLEQCRQVCRDHNAPIHLAYAKRKTLSHDAKNQARRRFLNSCDGDH